MQERQFLQIKTNRPELAEALALCGRSQGLFDIRGSHYRVDSFSRHMSASGVSAEVDLSLAIKPDWRGPEDGLPTVGLEVEVLYNSCPEGYVACKVLAHDEDRAVYRFTSGPRKGEYQSDREWFDCDSKRPMFRVIPTAEQLAEQERDAGINALCELMDGAGYRSAAERLYNAGVRAPEVK